MARITKVRKRDGSIEPFQQEKIEAAIGKAMDAASAKNGKRAKKLAQHVTKELEQHYKGDVIPSVEDVQDVVEEVLIKNDLSNVARAYILYRETHKDIREFKTFLGVRDELKLTPNAIKVLAARYLLKDEKGNVIETPARLFRRVAKAVAAADANYRKGFLKRTEDEFYDMMANLEFIPNSPTLMNAGAPLGQLSACFVLPIKDDLSSIFDTLKHTALIHQCLTPDTLVMTNHGLIALKEVSANSIITTDEGPFKVDSVHNNGTKPVYRVETEHGYQLSGTAEHKLLTMGKDGKPAWKEISKLKQNDWLMLSSSKWLGNNTTLPKFDFTPNPGRNKTSFQTKKYPLPTELTPELAELIGVYIGDGSNHRDGIRFTVSEKEKDLVQHLMQAAETIFSRHITVSKAKRDVYEVSVLSKHIKEWFTFLNIIKTSSKEANVPKIILQSTETIAAAFLRGLFTADGCIRTKGHITLTSASETLSRTVQIMLLHLGIPARLSRMPSTGIWHLSICSKEGFRQFKQKIGFCSQFKQARLDAINEKDIFVRGQTIPHQKTILREIYNTLPKEEKARAYPLINDIFYRNRELSVQRLSTLLSEFGNQEFAQEILHTNLFFTKVKDVTAAGESHVLDLTIPFKHAYIANGIISHNSGGGTGFNFSNIRPRGDIVKSTKGVASGPISFMRVFDTATDVLKQGGKRRGANMGILNADHPDIVEFVTAKAQERMLQNFNISVSVTDGFMEKAIAGEDYDLHNPRTKKKTKAHNAQEMLNLIIANAWRTGDPGLIFIDEINRRNPTASLGRIESTNPCGEQPLHSYESCTLGSINLAKMTNKNNKIAWDKLKKTIHKAVHFLDNVIDVNKYPLEQIEEITKGNRRIGLGVMGWAELLIMLNIPYDSNKALELAEKLAKFLTEEARKASNKLGEERGNFPNLEQSTWKKATRNATVTTIAPTGTISIIAGATSGIEPLFAVSYVRSVMEGTQLLEANPAFENIAKKKGFYSKGLMMKIAKTGSVQGLKEVPKDTQKLFKTALEIPPDWHVKHQAAFQKHIENAVSKTINLPEDATQKDVRNAYLLAYKLKCKGITIYRYGSKKEQVLYRGEHVAAESEYAGGHSCRECMF